jgi:hypothetical protein
MAAASTPERAEVFVRAAHDDGASYRLMGTPGDAGKIRGIGCEDAGALHSVGPRGLVYTWRPVRTVRSGAPIWGLIWGLVHRF